MSRELRCVFSLVFLVCDVRKRVLEVFPSHEMGLGGGFVKQLHGGFQRRFHGVIGFNGETHFLVPVCLAIGTGRHHQRQHKNQYVLSLYHFLKFRCNDTKIFPNLLIFAH